MVYERIDKYTSSTASAKPVSSSNVSPLKLWKYSSQAGASPSTLMKNNPSTTNPYMDSTSYRQRIQKLSFLPPPAISHPSSTFPAQAARVPSAFSSVDIRTSATQDQQQRVNGKPLRSSSMTTTPVNPNGYWLEHFGHSRINGTEPRIFPGAVCESTRRGSIRQGISSEHDTDGLAGPRAIGISGMKGKEHTALDGALIKEQSENESGASRETG